MTLDTHLRLDRLRLRNFRCFADCTVELRPDLTVFVAENGQGKTAVLDAIGIALGLFVDTIAGTRQFRGFAHSDVRLTPNGDGRMHPVLPTSFEAAGYVNRQPAEWNRALIGYGPRARTSTKDARTIFKAAVLMREDAERTALAGPRDSASLPLVASYGTGRLWSERRLADAKMLRVGVSETRLSGYVDCLVSSSSFNGMVAWYERRMSEIGDARFSTENRRNVPLITAVNEAVRGVLMPTGWTELDWDPTERGLVVAHAEHGRLPLSALSDGVRNMVALVADVARRCATLNPHLSEDAARQTPGLLLIDEVDLHLHPRWQQLIVKLFREAFPALQVVLSTHSPHVLSTVDKQSIRVIRLTDDQVSIDTPLLQTKGVQSADVLASIMGVDPVPQIPEAMQLSQYRALIEDGVAGGSEAQALRVGLVAHFGESHPLILDCDRLIRFQAFRLRRDRSEES